MFNKIYEYIISLFMPVFIFPRIEEESFILLIRNIANYQVNILEIQFIPDKQKIESSANPIFLSTEISYPIKIDAKEDWELDILLKSLPDHISSALFRSGKNQLIYIVELPNGKILKCATHKF